MKHLVAQASGRSNQTALLELGVTQAGGARRRFLCCRRQEQRWKRKLFLCCRCQGQRWKRPSRSWKPNWKLRMRSSSAIRKHLKKKTLHALTRKQEVLEAVKLGLAEKVLGTHQYLMTTKPPAALALSPPLAQARNASLLAPALPSLEDRPTPVAAEQQSLKPPCMHQKGSVLSMPLTQM